MRYPGIYRAVVVNPVDPDQALKVQVRVHGIHHRSYPDDALPWAYPLITGGRGMSGLFVPYKIGDNVIVQFEGGDVRFPVIMGGTCAAPPDGVSDIPFDMQEDSAGGRRILLVDERGNTLELSAKPGDACVRIKSGSSTVTVSNSGDTIVLDAVGSVLVKGSTVNVQAGTANTTAGTVNIRADTGTTENGVATLSSDRRTDILSEEDINIGGRVENLMGVPSPTSKIQTPRTNLRSEVVNVGAVGITAVATAISVGASPPTPSMDTMPSPIGVAAPFLLKPTLTVNIAADAQVNVTGGTQVNIATGAASVKATTVSVTALTSVTVSAPSINLGN